MVRRVVLIYIYIYIYIYTVNDNEHIKILILINRTNCCVGGLIMCLSNRLTNETALVSISKAVK